VAHVFLSIIAVHVSRLNKLIKKVDIIPITQQCEGNVFRDTNKFKVKESNMICHASSNHRKIIVTV
jgi:hypothetical protein